MTTLAQQLTAHARDGALDRGPVALVIAEDEGALSETIGHLIRLGFPAILVALPDGLEVETTSDAILTLRARTAGPGAVATLVGEVMRSLPAKTWFHYCFNGEFLFYPHAETRRVSEMLDFHASERRRALPTTVVDLYTEDLATHADGIDLVAPAFDRTGYFAEGDTIRGGLRWRFEDDIPPAERQISRFSLVRSDPALRLGEDHRWSDEDLNALSCPWHRNLTGAIASFRAAKALAASPERRDRIGTFAWAGSERFDWTSKHLLDAGFMEIGQWF